MKKARIVIGANFGDEGKGLVTDYLSHQTGPETLVVRFNGGAQAGHTVITPDSRRHVFGHIGSGAFNGCATLLSRFFICNPLVFLKESATLRRLGIDPTVYIDEASPVTTPFDMIVNQCVEEARGVNRHGSCGLGIGETIERHLRPAYALTYGELADIDLLRDRLIATRDEWLPQRLTALGVTRVTQHWQRIIDATHLCDAFIADIARFRALTQPATADLIQRAAHLIFEGAQGLLLDQDYGWFPHVTRSNTGMKNVAELARENGLTDLDVFYLTRSYLTRHGAGPMPGERFAPIYSKIHDPTNIPNPHQGTLRFGLLDIDLLAKSVFHDLRHVPSSIRCAHHLSVSCMDQIDDDQALCLSGAQTLRLSPNGFLALLQERTGAASILTSHGPTHRDVGPWSRRPSQPPAAKPAAYKAASPGCFRTASRESLHGFLHTA
jgi:adenylosuccinate synthase